MQIRSPCECDSSASCCGCIPRSEADPGAYKSAPVTRQRRHPACHSNAEGSAGSINTRGFRPPRQRAPRSRGSAPRSRRARMLRLRGGSKAAPRSLQGASKITPRWLRGGSQPSEPCASRSAPPRDADALEAPWSAESPLGEEAKITKRWLMVTWDLAVSLKCGNWAGGITF